MSNAIKYNRKKGKIKIQTQIVKDNRIRVSVLDTGNGLRQDQIQRLFNRFERLDQKTSSIEGAGIGLTISKKLVELMDGKIGVDSEVGKGSTFWIELSYVAEG